MTPDGVRDRERDGAGESDLVAAAFDALPAQVAVIDADGTIRQTNRGWSEFGLENDLQGDVDMVGENYLTVCDAGGDETSRDAASGIRSVLAGDDSEFALEYPCHSPETRRWFLMRAIALQDGDHRHALVMHVDITERKEAELEVSATNDALSTVATVLSHDLRNPLNVAMGRTEFLADDPDAGAERITEQTTAILSSLERIDAIIDDALLLAQGSEAVSTDRIPLETVARAAWSHVETRDATLDVLGDATVVADESLLTQLFENLFRNSVEHDEGAGITVDVTSDGFTVADDGPGIPVEDRDRVFEAGFSTHTGADNTGMGLVIVQRIADVHGWTVHLPADRQPISGGRTGVRFEFRGVTVER